MTPAELRAVCDVVGKSKLADLLGWTVRTMDRKLSGKHKITRADELAVRHVTECLER
jgi:hypothetical protein